jgi:hypothetical protein
VFARFERDDEIAAVVQAREFFLVAKDGWFKRGSGELLDLRQSIVDRMTEFTRQPFLVNQVNPVKVYLYKNMAAIGA